MKNLLLPGRSFYGIGIAGIGIQQFIYSAFQAMVIPNWPSPIPGASTWAYITGAVLILAGALIIFNKKARIVSLALGVLLFLLFICFHVYYQVFLNPNEFSLGSWTNPLNQLLAQVGDVGGQTAGDWRAGEERLLLQPLLLGGEHLQQLAPALDQEGELALGGIRQRPDRGLHLLGKAGEGQRIDPIGLGQEAGRAREVPHPRRIDDADRERGRTEGGDDRLLIAAGGLQHDERGTALRQLGGQLLQLAGARPGAPGRLAGPQRDLEGRLGDIDPDHQRGRHGRGLQPGRDRPNTSLADAGSSRVEGANQRCGLVAIKGVMRGPCFVTGSRHQGTTGLTHRRTGERLAYKARRARRTRRRQEKEKILWTPMYFGHRSPSCPSCLRGESFNVWRGAAPCSSVAPCLCGEGVEVDGTMTKVALLGVPYDASSSFQRGAAGAPVLIREALWSEAGNTWTETGVDLKEGGIEDEGDLWFSDREPGSEARARIEGAVVSILDSGRRPLILGGDHSITYPVLRGLRPHYPRLAILHLDAHPDLYHEFQGDPYSHACPFARIMEEGLADRLVQVGIRTMTAHQREQAKRFGVEVIEMRGWRDGDADSSSTHRSTSRSTSTCSSRGSRPACRTASRAASPFARCSASSTRSKAPLAGGADLVELNPLNDAAGSPPASPRSW